MITRITSFIVQHLAQELLKHKKPELIGMFRNKEKVVILRKTGNRRFRDASITD